MPPVSKQFLLKFVLARTLLDSPSCCAPVLDFLHRFIYFFGRMLHHLSMFSRYDLCVLSDGSPQDCHLFSQLKKFVITKQKVFSGDADVGLDKVLRKEKRHPSVVLAWMQMRWKILGKKEIWSKWKAQIVVKICMLETDHSGPLLWYSSRPSTS